jgi:hypothetical protein
VLPQSTVASVCATVGRGEEVQNVAEFGLQQEMNLDYTSGPSALDAAPHTVLSLDMIGNGFDSGLVMLKDTVGAEHQIYSQFPMQMNLSEPLNFPDISEPASFEVPHTEYVP